MINQHSRFNASAIAQSLARTLGDREALSLHVVRSSDEATEVARTVARPDRVVIAVGGDGTVADVATGIFGSGAVLGIVPAGSTNITARSLGIPANPRAAITLLASDLEVQSIDVGISGDRCFLHIAGAGFDAEIFRTANPAWKRRFGWLAYLPAAAAALRLAPSEVVVTCDHEEIEARSPLVLVANGGSAVVPEFKIHPRIAPDDGWLDVLIFTAITPAQVAATLGLLGGQRLDRSPHVLWRRASAVRIAADPALAVQLDGDTRGWTPRQFAIRPASMRIVAPSG